MDEGDNKQLVETFQEITSASKDEAIFFLESHSWNLDTALSTFLEDNPIPATATNTNTATATATDDDDDDDEDYEETTNLPPPSPAPVIPSSAVPMASRDKKPSKPSGSRAGGIRTLADLNRRPDPGSDSDSDTPQEYYTGGEKSGMLVQDPSKGNDVDSIFKQARELGATEELPDSLRPSSSSRSFTGTGRLLSGESVPSAPQEPEPVMHNIVFWRNGFTVNDGPLRRLDDPENASFIESIKKSECPRELEPADRRSQVHVNLTRRDENCPEPEKRHVPFQGVGRTLGSSAPPAAAAEQTSVTSPLNAAPLPSMGLVVDDTLPSTSIQLRLADGTRMVARFNYHHTVADIRGFIDASRPGNPRNYQLQTVGFPPKQLADVSQTVEQAGLANSVVIQKL